MSRTDMFNSEVAQKMKEAYTLGGMSLVRVAASYGVSVPTVARYLKDMGVELRGRGRPRKNTATVVSTEVDVDEVETLGVPTEDTEDDFDDDEVFDDEEEEEEEEDDDEPVTPFRFDD